MNAELIGNIPISGEAAVRIAEENERLTVLAERLEKQLKVAKARGDAWKATSERLARRLAEAPSFELTSMKVYDLDYNIGTIVFAANLLEQKGEQCGVRFSRDAERRILGIELGVREAMGLGESAGGPHVPATAQPAPSSSESAEVR